MDIATLHIVHAILDTSGIRAASRRTGRPVASVGAALKRMEAALALPLVRRNSGRLVPTLEAAGLMPDFAAAQGLIAGILSLADDGRPGLAPAIGLASLERFASVARAGSIRAAAGRLGLGQPHLTRQIADLERHLGCALVRRSASGVVCTPAGAALIPLAEALIELWHRLSRTSAHRFRRAAATWRLGSVMPFGPESDVARMLAALTAEWHRARPRQPLFLSNATADDLIAGLRSRTFDAVLLDLDQWPADLEGSIVSRTPLALAGAPHDATPNDLRGLLRSHPVAVPSLRSGLRREATRFMETSLTASDLDTLRLVEIDSIPVLINLVTHHGYLSILPESSMRRLKTPPALMPLGPDYRQTLSLVWPKEPLSRQIAQAMLELLQRERADRP